jgi:hypothetical protein
MDATEDAAAVPSLQARAILAELRNGYSAQTRREVWQGLGDEFVLVSVSQMGELPARLRVLPAADAPAWIQSSAEVALATYLAGELCAVDLGVWTDLVADAWRELTGPTDEEYERASWESIAYALERLRIGGGPAAERVASLMGELSRRDDYALDLQLLEMAVCYPIPALALRTIDDPP